MTTERWVSVEQVAQPMGVAKDTLDRWREQRGLSAHRVGRLWKFKLTEVDDRVRAAVVGHLAHWAAESTSFTYGAVHPSAR